jgi:hypothetical protein
MFPALPILNSFGNRTIGGSDPMAKRMSTRLRYDRIRDKGAVSRTVNGQLKRKERASRDKRMAGLIKAGKFPYTPSIQSWISAQLAKPFTQVTEEEVKGLVKS